MIVAAMRDSSGLIANTARSFAPTGRWVMSWFDPSRPIARTSPGPSRKNTRKRETLIRGRCAPSLMLDRELACARATTRPSSATSAMVYPVSVSSTVRRTASVEETSADAWLGVGDGELVVIVGLALLFTAGAPAGAEAGAAQLASTSTTSAPRAATAIALVGPTVGRTAGTPAHYEHRPPPGE